MEEKEKGEQQQPLGFLLPAPMYVGNFLLIIIYENRRKKI
jgi:hypothetical protein